MKKQVAKMMGVCGVALLAVAPMVETGAATVDAVRSVNVVNAAGPIDANTDLALTIVKYQKTDQNGEEGQVGDGTQLDPDSDVVKKSTPLKNIEFSVTRVKPTGAGAVDIKDAKTYTTDDTFAEMKQTTGDNGETTFNLGKYGAAKGIYLVQEVKNDAYNLKPAAPFLVQMPLKDQAHVFVYPKNALDYTAPTITKALDGLTYAATKDADEDATNNNAAIIGTQADYTLTATFPATELSEAYILDPIYKGLTFDKATGVTSVQAGSDALSVGTDYTVDEVTEDDQADFATQKIVFTKAGIDKIKGQTVTVNLTATVNKDAKQSVNGIDQIVPIQNTADVVVKTPTGANVTPGTSQDTGMTPGDPLNNKPSVPENPTDPTAPTTTKATNLQITKTDADDAATKLKGAEFELYQEDKTTLVPGSHVVTDDQGQAVISGIEQGQTYYLKETKAPADYTLNHDFIQVKADNAINTKVTVDGVDYIGNGKNITNDKDLPLGNLNIPLTGGQLRIILMVTGTILILGAGYILIKKRKEEENA